MGPKFVPENLPAMPFVAVMFRQKHLTGWYLIPMAHQRTLSKQSFHVHFAAKDIKC